MKVIVCENYEEESQKAFEVMKDVIQKNPHAILGLATGSSPEGLYKEMVKDYEENGTSYADITSYNLDEYVGIDRNHPESYYSFMHKHLFDHINIKPENTHLPEGSTQADADAYEAELKKVTIDLQLLGIGRNGHIGFNEPGTSFDAPTHIVDLTQSTLEANSRFFDNDVNKVPHQAMSMGLGSIMRSKKILLVANGANKADAVKAMVEGPVTEKVPASILQKHPDVVVVLDKAAASKLSK
ncbi:glucosamine-6-phosphate deaminase [Absicoccus porci]|uniref:glucosamine-6-phosphate deaminase n=1 Tax=Absicoccus porci TaxID=2486576 RepID=UPI0029436899|nr:glucosamine-6-phosphate deaminase [Absicoccus porci]MEE1355740.1 glucosamine-6-phosphate deaminase [Absicoccus porci]